MSIGDESLLKDQKLFSGCSVACGFAHCVSAEHQSIKQLLIFERHSCVLIFSAPVRMTIAVRVVSVALTLLLLVPAGVEARTHHVDSSGSDTVLIGGGVCELERPRRRAA